MPSPKFVPCAQPPAIEVDDFELARVAVAHNPANAPPREGLAAMLMTAVIAPLAAPGVSLPQFIAVSTSRYWGRGPHKFGVSFIDKTGPTTKNLILAHANAWSESCGVEFFESAFGVVRISRGQGGHWSYLGTDNQSIASDKATMNLQGFTERTSDAEYRRVARHEFGHFLGCPHEHMRSLIVQRLDRQKTIDYFKRTQGWSAEMTTSQVLTPIEETELLGGGSVDDDSIMAYQLPAQITIDRKPIVGGSDITPNDRRVMAALYPPVTPPAPPVVVPPPVVVSPPPPTQPATQPFPSIPIFARADEVIHTMRALGWQVTWVGSPPPPRNTDLLVTVQ